MSFAAQSQVRKPLDSKFLELELACTSSSVPTTKINVLFPIVLLAVFQVIDALLTLKGLSTFGPSAEGNPILRFLIELTSAPVALAVVKSFAIIVLFCLFNLLKKHPISWVPGAIWGINAVYLFGAIVPWSLLLV